MAHFFRFLLVFITLCSAVSLPAAVTDTLPGQTSRVTGLMQVTNPAAWMSDCYNRLNNIYLTRSETHLDTVEMNDRIHAHGQALTYLTKDFTDNKATLNIRAVYNLKMRVADMVTDISRWQNKVHHVNEKLVAEAREVLLIRKEINDFRENADSLFRTTFDEPLKQLNLKQKKAEILILNDLKAFTGLENRTISLLAQARVFHADLHALLKNKETHLLKRELPPIWESPPGVYLHSIGEVLAASYWQTLDSIRYYGEMSLWRIVLFRGLILLICLIPIRIFHDRQRKQKLLETTNLTFLEKFPKTASVVMGLAFAPVVFIHPPHAFMEFILFGLIFTVTMVTFKIYPAIDKGPMAIVVAGFMLLFLVNFFVTPTFVGRLIYLLSLFLLLPVGLVYRRLGSYGLQYEKTVRLFMILLSLHLVAGWILVVLGYYTLGRSVILAGYSLLIISMIMRIAIHTVLDYCGIIIYFINSSVSTVKINPVFFRQRLLPILVLLASALIVVSYLFTLSIFDIVKSAVLGFLLTPREVGFAVFTFRSILLFFLWVYAAFLISSTLRQLFEPQLSGDALRKSTLGSFMLFARMVILMAGIVLGILASGLPLSNFTIFLGALGVGIGFGLQAVVANLISGIVIAIERPFVVGDVLDFGSESGRVREISLRATKMSTPDGADILVPNSALLSENIKNWTVTSFERFDEFQIRTTTEADPQEVMQTIGLCFDGQDKIIREKSRVLFSEIEDSCFVFTVKYRLRDLSRAKQTKSRVLENIRVAFLEKGIRFGQRSIRE